MTKRHMIIALFFFGVLVILGGVALLYMFLRGGFAGPLPTGTLSVGGKTFSVEIAETTSTRAQGLSWRDPLPEGSGMLFIFSSASNYGFWMKDMKFALDFVWIRDNKVVGATENVPPPAPGVYLWSLPVYYPPEDADSILELDAGTVAKDGIKKGDVVILARNQK